MQFRRLTPHEGGSSFLPGNVLATPASPPLAELERMGVRRVSVGSGPARAAYGRLRQLASSLKSGGSWAVLGEGAFTYAEMQALFGAKG